MTAEEFLMKNPNQYLGMTPVEFAEAYHKHRVEAITDELYVKCNKCDGYGYYADHDPFEPHINGDCNGSCPVKCQCEKCETKGFVKIDLNKLRFIGGESYDC